MIIDDDIFGIGSLEVLPPKSFQNENQTKSKPEKRKEEKVAEPIKEIDPLEMIILAPDNDRFKLLIKNYGTDVLEQAVKILTERNPDDLKIPVLKKKIDERKGIEPKKVEKPKPQPKSKIEPAAKKPKEQETAEAIQSAIHNALDLFTIGSEPVTSNQDLAHRITIYFEKCEETQQLPTIEKLFLAVGYTTKTIEGWYAGKIGNNVWVNEITFEMLERAKQLISAIDSELVQIGRIKESTYLFRSKNYYGMQDKQEVVVTPNTEVKLTPEQLLERAKLLEIEEP